MKTIRQKIKEARLDERRKVLRAVELELNKHNLQHSHYFDADTEDECTYNKCPNHIIDELKPRKKK